HEWALSCVDVVLERVQRGPPLKGWIGVELLGARDWTDPGPASHDEHFHVRVEPLVGVDAPGLDKENAGRCFGLGCERRTAAWAIATQHPEPARPDIVEHRRF